MHKDFKNCNAVIYDEEDNKLAKVKIWAYDKEENSIEVDDLPELRADQLCKLLILTEPNPHSFKGRIHQRGKKKVITLFSGDVKKDRQDLRYEVDMSAHVEGIIRDGKERKLKPQVKTSIVDISKNGIRFRTKSSAFSSGDKLQIRLKSSVIDQLLIAEVVSCDDTSGEYLEFGCRLLGEEVGSQQETRAEGKKSK